MSCPGCGADGGADLGEVTDRLFRTTDERFHVRACAACGLRFLAPPPPPEALARYYPKGYWTGANAGAHGRATEAWRRFALRDHVRFVRRVAEEQRRAGAFRGLLDVGGGDGSFLDALGVRPAMLVDSSEGAVAAARARGWPAALGDLPDLPVRPGSVSLITLFHVLEHVRPAEPVLDALRETLGPGGDLVVQVPNCASVQAALFGARWQGYDPPRHLVNYSTATLARTLERRGFTVVQVTQFSFRDGPGTMALSLAPSLYPPARAARGLPASWVRDLGWLALNLLAVPFATLESLFGRGAAVMVQARVAR